MKLDIGSGPYPHGKYEWLHIDLYASNPHLEVICKGEELPFKEGSFDYVRASHVIEHLEIDKGLLLVREMDRVVKSMGTVEIVIPDFTMFIERWKTLTTTTKFSKNIQRDVLGDFDLGEGMLHKALYDAKMISYLLSQVGITVSEVDKVTRGPRDTIIKGVKLKGR